MENMRKKKRNRVRETFTEVAAGGRRLFLAFRDTFSHTFTPLRRDWQPRRSRSSCDYIYSYYNFVFLFLFAAAIWNSTTAMSTALRRRSHAIWHLTLPMDATPRSVNGRKRARARAVSQASGNRAKKTECKK